MAKIRIIEMMTTVLTSDPEEVILVFWVRASSFFGSGRLRFLGQVVFLFWVRSSYDMEDPESTSRSSSLLST